MIVFGGNTRATVTVGGSQLGKGEDDSSKNQHTLQEKRSSTTYMLDLKKREWSIVGDAEGTAFPPQPRCKHSASLIGDKMWIFGGWDWAETFVDLQCLSLTDMRWRSPVKITISPKFIPLDRIWHAACLCPDEGEAERLYILSGEDRNSFLQNDVYYTSIPESSSANENASLQELEWHATKKQGGSAGPSPRFAHTVSRVGSVLVQFGGMGGGLDLIFDDVWVYYTSSGAWRRMKNKSLDGPSGRYAHTCVSSEKALYICGGRNSSLEFLGDVYCLEVGEDLFRAEEQREAPCQWRCDVCTCMNYDDQDFCCACGSSSHHVGKNTTLEQLGTTAGSFDCAVCTFANEDGSECSMCGALRS